MGSCSTPKTPAIATATANASSVTKAKAIPANVFEGDPTPDMDPLDEEAEAISESLQEKWRHPINTLPANGGMNDAELLPLMRKMEAAFEKIAGPNTTSVPSKDVDELKALIDKQQAQINALLKSVQPSEKERRV